MQRRKSRAATHQIAKEAKRCLAIGDRAISENDNLAKKMQTEWATMLGLVSAPYPNSQFIRHNISNHTDRAERDKNDR